MTHIPLARGLGGGLGHAGRLKLLAVELARRGHDVSPGPRDLIHTGRLLRDLLRTVRADAVVGDCAPTAVAASRIPGFTALVAGSGFLDPAGGPSAAEHPRRGAPQTTQGPAARRLPAPRASPGEGGAIALWRRAAGSVSLEACRPPLSRYGNHARR